MATDFGFRKRAVAELTAKIGVYVLCDLDEVPIYVGQSRDGIRRRVQRHLTSARSDVIANRQIDVWEVAYVWTYPVLDIAEITPLEAALFHYFDPLSALMNGATPRRPDVQAPVPDPAQRIQVMATSEILEKQDPVQRLPRQAAHYAQIVSHFLTVKNSPQVARSMNAHFDRLRRYHAEMLGQLIGSDEPPGDGE